MDTSSSGKDEKEYEEDSKGERKEDEELVLKAKTDFASLPKHIRDVIPPGFDPFARQERSVAFVKAMYAGTKVRDPKKRMELRLPEVKVKRKLQTKTTGGSSSSSSNAKKMEE